MTRRRRTCSLDGIDKTHHMGGEEGRDVLGRRRHGLRHTARKKEENARALVIE
jgi:hypothetical protein